ncbi:hypothetical protein E3O44_00065 [Cryobacterium algoricola]|uniref:Meckel syndrome type 1 protein n=1 Tax=Cryobacterium algoricola TaxID=1259183 RepID=A0ABY2IHI8_9MICO|nr:hypothetical protein [Cryobacterium algoricola]TFB91296.1 hypothetical protein E3O44_00065 [Cryobacterium algoricola]
MDEAQAVRTPRALWLALVAIALGIAWFLCGGASSASATNLLPDTPPVADASAPAPPTASVPVAPALAAAEPVLPAVPAAAVPPAISAAPDSRAPSLSVETVVGDAASAVTEAVASDIDRLVSVSETAGAPIVAALVALTPPVTIPAVTLPTVSIPAATAPTASTAVAPPTSAVGPSADAAQADSAPADPSATAAFESLTPPGAAASAAATPLGAPGHPVDLPQPAPATAAAGGAGLMSVVANNAAAGGVSAEAARLTPEDDALPSSLATSPGSSPA